MKRKKVFKFTERNETKYYRKGEHYQYGYIFNHGEGKVSGVYDYYNTIQYSNLKDVTQFVENGIKEMIGRNVEFIDMNEMLIQNGLPTEIILENSIIEEFSKGGCNFYDSKGNLITTFGNCKGKRRGWKRKFEKITISICSVFCLENGFPYTYEFSGIFDTMEKWREFVGTVNKTFNIKV